MALKFKNTSWEPPILSFSNCDGSSGGSRNVLMFGNNVGHKISSFTHPPSPISYKKESFVPISNHVFNHTIDAHQITFSVENLPPYLSPLSKSVEKVFCDGDDEQADRQTEDFCFHPLTIALRWLFGRSLISHCYFWCGKYESLSICHLYYMLDSSQYDFPWCLWLYSDVIWDLMSNLLIINAF